MGECCRFHGRVVESPAIESALRVLPNAPVCPEMAAGLGCPRAATRKRKGRYFCGDVDVTDLLRRTCAKLAAKYAELAAYYIGVRGSPTCDPQHGIFTAALRRLGVPSRLSVRPGDRESAAHPNLPFE